MIEVVSTASLTTVQDLGRHSYRRFGVGTAGAMDALALGAGNLMLGNSADAAGIEIPVLPFSIRFHRRTEFAVTGADCSMVLDGSLLIPWWVHQALPGQLLTLGGDHAGFTAGARAYLLIAGGMDVPEVLGSRSTQLRGRFGGHEGRPLRDGDVLKIGNPGNSPRVDGFGIVPPAIAIPEKACGTATSASNGQTTEVRVLPAAEYAAFDALSQDRFWKSEWRISAQSDRYGYRMTGPALDLKLPMETRSHGVVPGVIQVPPGGPPIIQMRDAQPSGGYPKIGTVIEADMWKLAQAPTGSKVRFVECTYAEAVAALGVVNDYLGKVGHLCALYRSRNA